MTERTWGYWDQVGGWYGDVPLPVTERSPPIESHPVSPVDADPDPWPEIHRPRRISVSWGERNKAEERRSPSTSWKKADISSWDDVRTIIARLPDRSSHEVAVSTLFVDLDTRIIEGGRESWSEDSASLQASVPPGDEKAPEWFHITYQTAIDIWLPTTHGSDGLRSNRAVAAENMPRFEAFLRDLASLTGEALVPDRSKRYGDAVTATGFQDLDSGRDDGAVPKK